MPDARSGRALANAVWPGASLGPKPAHTGPKIPRTSCASLTAFINCPQLYAFGYEMGLGLEFEEPARKIGSLLHVGLAYRYGGLLEQKPSWMVYPGPREAIWTCGQNTPEAAIEALRLFDAYVEAYPQPQWRPLLVEHQFQTDLMIDGRTERYTLRVDLVGYDVNDGALTLVDHKSIGRMTAKVGQRYTVDREMLTGLALCRAAGLDIERVVINAISKERPPRFGLFDVALSPEAYARLGTETVDWIRRLRQVAADHPDPTERPRAYENCMGKYGVCDFYSVCAHSKNRLGEYVKKWGK